MWVCVCGGVLVICLIVFTVFLYCFVYVYLFLFVTSKDHCHRVKNSRSSDFCYLCEFDAVYLVDIINKYIVL